MSDRIQIELKGADAASWAAFRALCTRSGTSASREVRAYIRARVEEYQAKNQEQATGGKP